jgi:5'-nucleotidase
LDEGKDSDIHVLNEGLASVTPIQYDLTAYDLLDGADDDSLGTD